MEAVKGLAWQPLTRPRSIRMRARNSMIRTVSLFVLANIAKLDAAASTESGRPRASQAEGFPGAPSQKMMPKRSRVLRRQIAALFALPPLILSVAVQDRARPPLGHEANVALDGLPAGDYVRVEEGAARLLLLLLLLRETAERRRGA